MNQTNCLIVPQIDQIMHQISHQIHQTLPPNLPNQPPNPSANPPDPMQPQNPPPQLPQLSWSYFKPEFSGKAEEDAVTHLLRTNDWMETHNFPDDTKVRRFC